MSAFTQAINNNWNPEEWSLVVGAEDTGFLWRPCDCCGSRLGGDRHEIVAINNADKSIISLDACVDCLMYIAYGDEPESWEG